MQPRRPRNAVLCLVLAVVLLLAVVPAGTASAQRGHSPGASAFAVRIVRLIGENRYAEAWASLHPLHQQAAPLDTYVRCESLTPIPGRITSLRKLRTWDAPIHVAGLADPVDGTKVKLRIVISNAAVHTSVPVVLTVGLVQVAGHWVWLLPQDRYDAYLAGQCPQ